MTSEHRIILVLDRLRSAYNTGNIFRLAEAFGAEIVACGYTPAPPHPKLAKTAMGTDRTVPCRTAPDGAAAIAMLRGEIPGLLVYAVDNLPGSRTVWEADYRFPLALVLGNEALGIEKAALTGCDGVIRLPMFGNKSSINVGNAAAATLYAIAHQAGLSS